MTSAVIDAEILQELKDVMGADFPVLVESFINDGEQRVAAIAHAIEQQNSGDVRAQAHSFKGSSSNLGASELSGYCMSLEQAAASGNLADAQNLLAQIQAAFLSAQRALRQQV